MVKKGLLILFLLACCLVGMSQQQTKGQVLTGIKIEGDTLPHLTIGEIYVFPRKDFSSRRYEQQYWRLVNKVKKVYPFAKRAKELLNEYDQRMKQTTDRKLRRKYMKQVEDQLFKEYGPQLKKLTITEGRILIKLIDRETGNTSYELIQDLKGKLTAFFWQGVAKVFGNNLKSHYDPKTEDRMIEEIIFYIEAGVIQ